MLTHTHTHTHTHTQKPQDLSSSAHVNTDWYIQSPSWLNSLLHHLLQQSNASSTFLPPWLSSGLLQQGMIQSTSTPDTGSTTTPVDLQVELTRYPDGEGLPPKKDGEDGPHQESNPFNSLPREFLFVGVICLAQLSTQISLGQTLNLIHIIGDHFSTTNPGVLSWFVAGYSLTVGSFILLFGRFGDYFGYKRLFVICLCWFSLWSMVAGISNYSNHILFIFARVLQGKVVCSIRVLQSRTARSLGTVQQCAFPMLLLFYAPPILQGCERILYSPYLALLPPEAL